MTARAKRLAKRTRNAQHSLPPPQDLSQTSLPVFSEVPNDRPPGNFDFRGSRILWDHQRRASLRSQSNRGTERSAPVSADSKSEALLPPVLAATRGTTPLTIGVPTERQPTINAVQIFGVAVGNVRLASHWLEKMRYHVPQGRRWRLRNGV